MRTVALALLLAGLMASEPALAHGGARVSVGVGFGYGYPYWGPWGPWGYGYYPYYYPVQTVVVPAQPTTYIEQAQPDMTGWWYYCDASRGYYPYVKECPSGWLRVPPTPPPAVAK